MSKIIKLTEQVIQNVVEDFKKTLAESKLSDGKISFTKTFEKVERRASLIFTETAFVKMLRLVSEFDKEVAWHGVATRGENPEIDEYIVSDILVYPQEVTGATVQTDQQRYETWLMSNEDYVFNNIRMQGHSHVNMGTTPSAVDTTYYEQILEMLGDNDFYIFLIWNKRNDRTVKIYDMGKNILFDTEDIDIKTIDDGLGLATFLEEAKSMVQDKVYSLPKDECTYAKGQNEKSAVGSDKDSDNKKPVLYKKKKKSWGSYHDDFDFDKWGRSSYYY